MIQRIALVIGLFLFPLTLLAQPPATAAAQPQDDKKAAATAPKPYPVMSAAAKARARELYGYLVHSKANLLYAAFAPEMQKNSSVARLTAASQKLASLGSETKLVSEVFQPSMMGAGTSYVRVSRYTKAKQDVIVNVGINEDGQLNAMQFGELPALRDDPSAEYKTKAKLRLPFKGDWMVYQGGRTLSENAFAASPDRHAVAFVLLKDGRPFSGTGTTNHDYYCFGQPVLAPADGTIVQLQNGYPDAQPGRPMVEIGKGNYVVISHGDGEFSVLSSLKQGSIRRGRGEKVKAGDVVGSCGNSGTAAIPHIEYRLQSTRGIPEPVSLPAQFVDYVADGKPVASGEPTRGQMVANAAADESAKPAQETAKQ